MLAQLIWACHLVCQCCVGYYVPVTWCHLYVLSAGARRYGWACQQWLGILWFKFDLSLARRLAAPLQGLSWYYQLPAAAAWALCW